MEMPAKLADVTLADASLVETLTPPSPSANDKPSRIHLTRVFDTDLTRTIGDAFDAVWTEVVKDPRYSRAELEFARGYLAERIIDLAQNGEADPARLRAEGCALFHLVQAAQAEAGTSSSAAALSRTARRVTTGRNGDDRRS
ncbi:MAG: hypothetical protein KF697_14500 [Pseudolabrys sp.]|nr:hypothetical protein [Pseudolabrys sp.]